MVLTRAAQSLSKAPSDEQQAAIKQQVIHDVVVDTGIHQVRQVLVMMNIHVIMHT